MLNCQKIKSEKLDPDGQIDHGVRVQPKENLLKNMAYIIGQFTHALKELPGRVYNKNNIWKIKNKEHMMQL
jgi:hypothetical protein